MNRMLRNALLCVPGLLAAASVQGKDPTEAKDIRILLTYGGHKFQEAPFFEMFDNLEGVTYTKAPLPESADLLKPGLEKEYDAIVMYDMAKTITPEQCEAFANLLETGIGVVSLHHNLGAYAMWEDYRNVIGGKWIAKAQEIDGKEYVKSTFSHGEDIKVAIADKKHPITRGLKDFEIHDEAYGKVHVSPKVHVLLKTDHPKNAPQVAWTTRYGKSPVFYLMLGHDAKAWENPNYPTLLSRGIRWVAAGGTDSSDE